VDWNCDYCRGDTDHKVKPSNIKSMPEYKLLICKECNTKKLVPKEVLGKGKVETKIDVSVSVDGGFDRDVGSDCEGGVCPVR